MKTIRPYLLTCLLITGQAALWGQDGFNDVLENYRKEHRLEGKYPYVYAMQTKAGALIRYSFYYQSGKQYILATFIPDSNLIREKKFNQDFLFTLVKENEKKLVKGSQSPKLTADLWLQYRDTSYLLTQIGIRYGNLHFNHFESRLTEDCATISNSKIRDACITIRQIAGIFKEIM